MRDYKSNIGFFTKWDRGDALGIGIMIAGFVMLWLGRGPIYRIAGATLLFGGLIVFLVLTAGVASEKHIREEIRQKCEGIFIELQGDSHFFRRVPANPKEYILEGFLYDKDVYLKRIRNGDIVSSRYQYAKAQVLNDAFYIRVRTFSLTSDETEDAVYDIHFDSIEAIEVRKHEETRTPKDKPLTVKVCQLVIVYDGGKELTLPKADDIYNDDYVYEWKKDCHFKKDAE